MTMRISRRFLFALPAALACLLFLFSARPTPAQDQPDSPLLVATKPLEPFVYLDGERPTGFSIDLWEEIADRLAFDYEWVRLETVGEVLEMVEAGQADVGIAGISMTREREQVVDFTHPFFDAGLQIMVAAGSGHSVVDLFRLLITPGLLAILVIGLLAGLVMAHLIWLIERRGNPDFPRGYFAGIWESIWWLLTIVANGEYPDKSTRSVVKRLLTIGFWLIGLALVAQFTGVVTSTLTVEKLSSNIAGPGDLPGKRVATVTGSTAATYLEGRQIPYTGVTAIEEAYALLLDGRIDAVVYDAPVLQFYSVNQGSGLVVLVGGIFKPEKYGIALPQGSPLREPINEVLLELYQDGTMEVLYDRWFGD